MQLNGEAWKRFLEEAKFIPVLNGIEMRQTKDGGVGGKYIYMCVYIYLYVCVCLNFCCLGHCHKEGLIVWNKVLCKRSPMGSHIAIKTQPLHMAAAAFGVSHLGAEERQSAVLIDALFPP